MVDVVVVELIGDVAMDVKLGPIGRGPADAGDVSGLVDQVRGQVGQVTNEGVVIVGATQGQVMCCQGLVSNATRSLLLQEALILL